MEDLSTVVVFHSYCVIFHFGRDSFVDVNVSNFVTLFCQLLVFGVRRYIFILNLPAYPFT